VKGLCVLACLLSMGQTSNRRTAPTTPWSLRIGRIPVPGAFGPGAAAYLDYEDGEPIDGVVVDLNGDGVNDYLIVSANRMCGTGGCAYLLYDGASEKRIGEFFGDPLIVRPKGARAYPDISTYTHLTVRSGIYTTRGFDGKIYVVSSSRAVEGPELDRLFDPLRAIPFWPPPR
jgi:hypothetical protein